MALDYLTLLHDCSMSLFRVSIGFVAASVVGIPLGFLRSSLPTSIKKNPFFIFLCEAPKFPPPIAWIPFVILLFGIGELPAYIIVFIGAFSPIFVSSYEAAESLPLPIRETANSLELSRRVYLKEIYFPCTLPQVLVGLRSGLSMGWMSVIAAELISGQSGLGYSIQLNRINLQYTAMAVDIFLIGILGYFLFLLMNMFEKLICPWHEKFRKEIL